MAPVMKRIWIGCYYHENALQNDDSVPWTFWSLLDR